MRVSDQVANSRLESQESSHELYKKGEKINPVC